jgi:phosphoserine phosphatase RsbU/P
MKRRAVGLASNAAVLAALAAGAGAGTVMLGLALGLVGGGWLSSAFLLALASLGAAGGGWWAGRRLSTTVEALASSADAIIRGDRSERPRVSARSVELRRLAENLDLVAERVAVLTYHASERAALETELEVGRRIQALTSPSGPLALERVAITGELRPASPAGGGFWFRRELAGGRTLVAIGDATGRGLPAAMLTATARAAVDVAVAALGEEIRADRVLALANHAVLASARKEHSMTCFVAILDPEANTAQCANAGHPFPYLHRRGAGEGVLEPITCRGNRLGELGSSHYESWQAELLPGDAIVLFSEGVIRSERVDGEAYGEKRLRHAIRRRADGAPQALCDDILADHVAFLDGTPPNDDVVVVVAVLSL